MPRNEFVKLSVRHKLYPELLREIPDRPQEIFCRGNIDLLNTGPSVAIVGSRKATDYGLKYAKKIAFELAESGIVIISGLALGIDAEAHRGALEAGGRTIAVLGCAIDEIYPAQNQSLGDKILKSDNLIISEYAPKAITYKTNFPQRNRIIAGLSRAAVIIEAAERSGALITALLALDYNREVFALPGNVDRINSKGTNYFIKKGANCLTGSDDILEFLGMTKKNRVRGNLSAQETKIVEILGKETADFDGILRRGEFDAHGLNVMLMNMEIKGIVRRTLDGSYGLC